MAKRGKPPEILGIELHWKKDQVVLTTIAYRINVRETPRDAWEIIQTGQLGWNGVPLIRSIGPSRKRVKELGNVWQSKVEH